MYMFVYRMFSMNLIKLNHMNQTVQLTQSSFRISTKYMY